MQITFDRALIAALALCYLLARLGAPSALAGISVALLAVLAVRIAGSALGWILTGR
ncbi:MAG TPA: hypothetical protein PKD29_01830 [Rhodocyclaceae bacterium]|nr:hypothetical protein [Rhodocyclaceae bacterium]